MNPFEDVLKAWQVQVNYYAIIFAIYNNVFVKLSNDYLPLPFCSLVSKNCIKEGYSLFDRKGFLKGAVAILIGLSNVGNCFCHQEICVRRKETNRKTIKAYTID